MRIRFYIFLLTLCHTLASATGPCLTVDERLNELASADQQIRQEWNEQQQNPDASNAEKEELQQRWRAIDAGNLAELKTIIAACGWPSGAKGSHSAWLLAQHADSDIAFQRQRTEDSQKLASPRPAQDNTQTWRRRKAKPINASPASDIVTLPGSGTAEMA